MARRARLDAEGTLHHVIIRGIEKKVIFADDIDREGFIKRMGQLALETGTKIFALSLMSNMPMFFCGVVLWDCLNTCAGF